VIDLFHLSATLLERAHQSLNPTPECLGPDSSKGTRISLAKPDEIPRGVDLARFESMLTSPVFRLLGRELLFVKQQALDYGGILKNKHGALTQFL
jgi:hypothetical protein